MTKEQQLKLAKAAMDDSAKVRLIAERMSTTIHSYWCDVLADSSNQAALVATTLLLRGEYDRAREMCDVVTSMLDIAMRVDPLSYSPTGGAVGKGE